MTLIVPPIWLIEAATNNTAYAPTTSDIRERYNLSDWQECSPTEANTGLKNDLIEYLRQNTAKNGLYDKIYATIMCESSWRPFVYGDHNLAYSLAQFHKPTFEEFNKKRGSNLDYYNPFDQIDLMIWAFENNLQTHWTCWKKIIVHK
jgi:hypothetical protein